MFILGLLLPICYCAGITGAAIPTQWAFLSITLPIFLWNRTPMNWLGLGLLALAAVSILWMGNPHTGVFGCWLVIIWLLSSRLGSVSKSLTQLWKGLAIGLSISSIVAVIQWFGYAPVLVAEGPPPGLLFNSTAQGAAIALVVIALICYRLWWYIPVPLIGLALSQSRGAWLVIALGLIAKYFNPLLSLSILTAGCLVFAYTPNPADTQRLEVWGMALNGLDWIGWGPFSFNDIYYIRPTGPPFHPEHVHNDFIELWFEYGIFALLPFAALGIALTRIRSRTWPILFSWACLACFYFPLYTPITAFIGCVCLGHILRNYSLLRDERFSRGLDFLSSNPDPVQAVTHPQREGVPVGQRVPQLEV